MRILALISFILFVQCGQSQVLLDSDGPGDTYELITSILAPGFNPIETPDCSHEEFGDHIDEVFDNELNSHVFRFHIHTDQDDDRCINFDRQRNEIKTYDKSPDNLLGIEGETVMYKWKFKLEDGFQSSPKFTHLHQLKSVGGPFESMPMYTLTTRKGSPDQLELRYAETDEQVTLTQTDLNPFIGEWLDVTETIEYGNSGTYDIEIKRVSDDVILFSYSTAEIVNWRPDAEFVRPKWGIYRSLLFSEDLRDEIVYFANFSIEEVQTTPEHVFNPTSEVFTNGVLLSWNLPSNAIGCQVKGGPLGGNDGGNVTVLNSDPFFVFVSASALGNGQYQWKVRCATDINPPQGITEFSNYNTFSFPSTSNNVQLAPSEYQKKAINKW